MVAVIDLLVPIHVGLDTQNQTEQHVGLEVTEQANAGARHLDQQDHTDQHKDYPRVDFFLIPLSV